MKEILILPYTITVNYLTLRELSTLIKSTIESSLIDEYWVTAEIAQITCHYSGHCYIDLVEKQDDDITAKMRATIWARNYNQISANFRSSTEQDLQKGMKILMLVRITYHEVHGLSLNIRKIDPSYTLGAIALKRKEIIEKLTKEGIIDRNRSLSLPPVIQNIVVISSATAAGYGDFISRLDNNLHGYKFSYKLFQAYVQGEQAEESIINALEQCKRRRGYFDAVVIIRGGGTTVDLHCFDSYLLAKEIALFPSPVFTGIGHERDETVADRVANTRFITPTAVADFLISRAKQFEESIDSLRNRLIIRTNTLIEKDKNNLQNLAESLSGYSKHYLNAKSLSLRNYIHLLQTRALSTLKTPSINLKAYESRLESVSEGFIKINYQKIREFVKTLTVYPRHILIVKSRMLEHLETKIKLLDPLNVLRRGYSITYFNEEVIKGIAKIKKADKIDTRLYNGTIISIVDSIREDKDE